MTTPTLGQQSLELAKLPAGSLVDVETRNRHYLIETMGDGEVRISGHPTFCASPVSARLQGSITTGRRLVFVLGNCRPVTTTKVLRVHVEDPKPSI